MITDEIFTDELLEQVTDKLAAAINDSLPPLDECKHEFSKRFEENTGAAISKDHLCRESRIYLQIVI